MGRSLGQVWALSLSGIFRSDPETRLNLSDSLGKRSQEMESQRGLEKGGMLPGAAPLWATMGTLDPGALQNTHLSSPIRGGSGGIYPTPISHWLGPRATGVLICLHSWKLAMGVSRVQCPGKTCGPGTGPETASNCSRSHVNRTVEALRVAVRE